MTLRAIMRKHYKICIIGLGSIGTRHLYNIVSVLEERKISFTIDLLRSDKNKQLEGKKKDLINKVFYSYNELPCNYDIIFVTNPTNLHFETVKKCVPKTDHMFIEKPVFANEDICVENLSLKRDMIYYVACPLRYSNVIQYLKSNFDLNSVYSARVISSSYLPDWRSNLDYRETYSARTELGGGVSIDLIHEWDYLYFLFGNPQKVCNISGKFSHLEIESEDLSIYIAKFNGLLAEVHLDYFGRVPIREIQIFTNEDTVVGDLKIGRASCRERV